jgi:AcrR family transcriptional regulator
MAQTRQRVLDAACALLEGEDLRELSLDDVAAQAGVGRTTLFQQFGSRAGLLRAVEQEVSARAGVAGLRQELAHPGAEDALRAAFEVGALVWAAQRPAFRQLFGLARVDPEMRQVMAEKDEIRKHLIAELVGALRKQGRLRGSPERARDLLWLLTSFESFDAVYSTRGSAEATARLLLEVARTMLLKA